MADIVPIIETAEHHWMRSWIRRDAKKLKSLTSRNFRMLVASKPGVILDGASLVEAAITRFQCSAYRFGDLYVRKHGSLALFATQLELEATMDGKDWSGLYWVTDLWQKGRVRRSWRLAERILSKPDERAEVASSVRALQLWR